MKKSSKKKIKNTLKTVLKILLAIFLIIFICRCIGANGEANPMKEAIYMTILLALLFMAFFGGIAICLLIIYWVFDYLTERNIQITKLDKIDLINDKQLYRDILNNYSPVLLAYIDKMRFDYDSSIVTGLLSLKNKGYIEICEDKLKVIKYDFYNLDMSEKYIIENIRNGKVENASELKEIIYEEGKKAGLLILNEKRISMSPKGIRNLMIFTIIYFFLIYPIFEGLITLWNNSAILNDIVSLVLFLGYVYLCFFASKSQDNLYDRSKDAKELNKKLEGLKNYIEEYSLLKEKTSEDITLWEEYLIYSVMFNQNKDIIEEYKKYY